MSSLKGISCWSAIGWVRRICTIRSWNCLTKLSKRIQVIQNSIIPVGLLMRSRRRLLESAAAFYEKGAEVARKDPQYFDYVKCDGQLLGVRRALGQLDQSIEYFKQRISENPEDLKAYALLTQAYYLADQLPEAQKVIEAAYKIDSEHPLITYWKGLIYSRLGRLDQALDLMNQTISHDPTFIDARYTLANLYERLQKLEEAVEEWQLIIAYHREHFPEVSMDWEEEQLARLKSKMEEH